MNTIKISLAKALKVKKRLTTRLATVENYIINYNSVIKEQREQYDIDAAIAERNALKMAIINIKNMINKENVIIQPILNRYNERKSDIAFYERLPVTEGSSRHHYQNTEVVYIAAINEKEVRKLVRRTEKELDSLQDEIDAFNNATKLEVDQKLLDLASAE